MKRIIAASAVAVVVSAAGAGVALAYTIGTPEVDTANATIQMGSVKPHVVTCAGEDGITYQTFRWNWAGGETDGTPGSTDYNLSGTLSVKNVQWTINLKTGRGILEGAAALVNSAGAPTYAGPLFLVTQGLPAAGATVPARGWINARTFTNGTADGGSLLANVEMQIGGGMSANGVFGNASMGIQDYSVAFNNLIC